MYDIIIIGAGLAGLNTARYILKNSDCTVTIVSRERSPKNNPLRLTFMETIQRFGLENSVRAAYKALGIINHYGTQALYQYENTRFVALDYWNACQSLKTEILKFPNLTYLSDRVLDFKTDSEKVEAVLSKNKSISGKLIIDASGRSHFSQKQLANPIPQLYSHSFGESLNNCTVPNLEEAWFIGGSADYGSGGGWYYPTGPNSASVGFAVITSTVKFPSELIRNKYYRAIKEIWPLKNILRSAKRINLETGTIPIGYIPVFTWDRLLVVGDAAGQATPWMCMGVEPALLNSELAAQAAINAFKNDSFSKEALSEYDIQWRKANLSNYSKIESMEPKIWFTNEAVWDFIIEKDLNALSPEQFYERIRHNKHLMSRWKSIWRWIQFRIKHFGDWKKYKAITE